jgi:hypothetical protein
MSSHFLRRWSEKSNKRGNEKNTARSIVWLLEECAAKGNSVNSGFISVQASADERG